MQTLLQIEEKVRTWGLIYTVLNKLSWQIFQKVALLRSFETGLKLTVTIVESMSTNRGKLEKRRAVRMESTK